jgi:hypothetical protein
MRTFTIHMPPEGFPAVECAENIEKFSLKVKIPI